MDVWIGGTDECSSSEVGNRDRIARGLLHFICGEGIVVWKFIAKRVAWKLLNIFKCGMWGLCHSSPYYDSNIPFLVIRPEMECCKHRAELNGASWSSKIICIFQSSSGKFNDLRETPTHMHTQTYIYTQEFKGFRILIFYRNALITNLNIGVTLYRLWPAIIIFAQIKLTTSKLLVYFCFIDYDLTNDLPHLIHWVAIFLQSFSIFYTDFIYEYSKNAYFACGDS